MGLVDIELGTEEQDKPGSQGLVFHFGLGILGEPIGRWQVA